MDFNSKVLPRCRLLQAVCDTHAATKKEVELGRFRPVSDVTVYWEGLSIE